MSSETQPKERGIPEPEGIVTELPSGALEWETDDFRFWITRLHSKPQVEGYSKKEDRIDPAISPTLTHLALFEEAAISKFPNSVGTRALTAYLNDKSDSTKAEIIEADNIRARARKTHLPYFGD